MNLRILLVSVSSTLALFCGLDGADKRPNVLFIAIDDLNNWVGCLKGHPNALTPNIDKLARRGVLFSNAHCSAPACGPSRFSLMTGIAPYNSGVYHNKQSDSRSFSGIPSLPQIFRENGFKTLGSGKLFHDNTFDELAWDMYIPRTKKIKTSQENIDNRYSIDVRIGDIEGVDVPEQGNYGKGTGWGIVYDSDSVMPDYQVASWVISQLQKKHEKSFFLGCGIFKPHQRWDIPKRHYDAFPIETIELPKVTKNDLSDVPQIAKYIAAPQRHAKVLKDGVWKQGIQAYLAAIHFADAQVGRVLDALYQSEYANNTIICLWSDHGWHLGEKEHWTKFSLWEDTTQTVMIFAGPTIPQGEECNAPTSLLDIAPTFFDFFGFGKNPKHDGKSLLPLLKDPELELVEPVYTTHGKDNHSLRFPSWRYTKYRDGSIELYDILKDPNEWNNLALDKKYTKIIEELDAYMPNYSHKDQPFYDKLPLSKFDKLYEEKKNEKLIKK